MYQACRRQLLTIVRTFVINLARSADRRDHMQRELAKTGALYEFLTAVEGSTLDLTDPSLVDQVAVGKNAFALGAGTPGAIGCLLSHLHVYERVANGDEDCALILEDDVSLPSDLVQLADAVAAHMSGREATLFSFASQQREWTLAEPPISLPAGRQLVSPEATTTRALHSSGAYLITKEAAERLAGLILPARVPADSWGTFMKWGALTRVRCVLPMPIRHLPAFRSTIEFYDANSLQGRLRALAARTPAISVALEARRQRRFRRSGWTGDVSIANDS